jgi:hypothetical protein
MSEVRGASAVSSGCRWPKFDILSSSNFRQAADWMFSVGPESVEVNRAAFSQLLLGHSVVQIALSEFAPARKSSPHKYLHQRESDDAC